jgi:hypothetical protein
MYLQKKRKRNDALASTIRVKLFGDEQINVMIKHFLSPKGQGES